MEVQYGETLPRLHKDYQELSFQPLLLRQLRRKPRNGRLQQFRLDVLAQLYRVVLITLKM